MPKQTLTPEEKTKAREDILKIIDEPSQEKKLSSVAGPEMHTSKIKQDVKKVSSAPKQIAKQAPANPSLVLLAEPPLRVLIPKIALSTPKSLPVKQAPIKKVVAKKNSEPAQKKKALHQKHAPLQTKPAKKEKRRPHPEEKHAVKKFLYHVLFFVCLMMLGIGAIAFFTYQYQL